MTTRGALLAAAGAAAVAIAAVPAVIGLSGNASFNHQIPVRPPSGASTVHVVDVAATPAAAPAATPDGTSGPLRPTPTDDHPRPSRSVRVPTDDWPSAGRRSGSASRADDDPSGDRRGGRTARTHDDASASAGGVDDHGGRRSGHG